MRTILTVNAATIPAVYQAVADTLRRRRGRFVVITSQAALRGERDNAAYCAAKWAAQAWLTAQVAAEGPGGVAVRALCPGRTLTPLLEDSMNGVAAAQRKSVEQYTAEILTVVPLARFARTAEIAAAALYLAEPGLRPAVLAVSGGEVPH